MEVANKLDRFGRREERKQMSQANVVTSIRDK
jgi:hypothetical protein